MTTLEEYTARLEREGAKAFNEIFDDLKSQPLTYANYDLACLYYAVIDTNTDGVIYKLAEICDYVYSDKHEYEHVVFNSWLDYIDAA